MRIAIGMLGGTIVYVAYYPSDSVSVENGDALWMAALAILIAALVAVSRCIGGGQTAALSGSPVSWADRLLDIVPWMLASWMMLAAFASSPPGNLRMSTNEAWFWVSAAALFTAGRWLMQSTSARQATLALAVACSGGLAAHGLHQKFVSLPANRLAYEQDPDRVLMLAGLEAPAGSAERMVFENRLFDGGPTGTFALANSLAGVLLVGVVLSIGILRFHWHGLSPAQRVAWGMAVLLCGGCLLATRSRSGAIAMLVGAALMFVVASRLRATNRKAMLLGLAGVSVFGIGLSLFIASVGNREWLAQAPASLSFRFQYWRSTWQMAVDRPVWTAGPGNYQSIYSRYREPSATEQIAEPHNLFFETLASGGFVGLVLLGLIFVAGFTFMIRRKESQSQGENQADAADRSWLWLGAGVSLAMIWLLGLASRNPPDLQASLYVIPVSLVLAFVLGRSLATLTAEAIDSIIGVAIITVGLHLMVSGGWTVPGVVVGVWIGAAILTRKEPGASAAQAEQGRSLPLAGALACLALLATLYLMSIRPVEARKLAMATAAAAQADGRPGTAMRSLQQAVEADPWSPEAALWLADQYRWRLVIGGDRPENRRPWFAWLTEAKRRAGDDPAVYRMVGAQQLHVYQRLGNRADLQAAGETFQAAVDWSPSDQWMLAQMAVIADAMGQTEKGEKLADRALQLSRLGGNIERDLSRQLLYEARQLEDASRNGPRRRPADELLGEPANR